MSKFAIKPVWKHPALALVLPIALIMLGGWQLSRVGSAEAAFEGRSGRIEGSIARLQADLAKDPQLHVRFGEDPTSYTAIDAIGRLQTSKTELGWNLLIEHARRVSAWTAAGAGILGLLAVLTCLLVTMLGARRGLRSRDDLVLAFQGVVRVLPVCLGAVAVAGALGVVGVVLFEAGGIWFMDSISTGDIKLIVIGLVGAVASVAFAVSSVRQLRRALDAFTPHPMQVLGRAATASDAPALWSFVGDLAKRQGAKIPDNIVLGLTEGFYVTSSSIRIAPEGRVLSGRSLYMPMGLLPLLNRSEITAVIAHELAHFTGADTEYSLHFLPLFNSIERSMAAVAQRRSARPGLAGIMMPAGLLAGHVLANFDRVVSHWSRLREFEADQASLRAGTGRGAATALLRIGMGSTIVHRALATTYKHPSQASGDVVGDILSIAGAVGFAEPERHLEDRQPHPTDSHPPTRQRIEALGVAVDASLTAEAARPVQQADAAFAESLFPDWQASRQQLGADLLAIAHRDDRDYQARLEQAATAITQDIPIHEGRLWFRVIGLALPGIVLIGLGGFFAWYGSSAVHTEDVQWSLGIGGAMVLLGAGFVLYSALCYRRIRSGPFLIVGADGFKCRGISGLMPWSMVTGIQVITGRAFLTVFTFAPGVPMPVKTARAWMIKIDGRRRQLRLRGYVPRAMTPQAYLDLLNSGLRAHRAQALLHERESGRPA